LETGELEVLPHSLLSSLSISILKDSRELLRHDFSRKIWFVLFDLMAFEGRRGLDRIFLGGAVEPWSVAAG
jgi:hypothetical protein